MFDISVWRYTHSESDGDLRWSAPDGIHLTEEQVVTLLWDGIKIVGWPEGMNNEYGAVYIQHGNLQAYVRNPTRFVPDGEVAHLQVDDIGEDDDYDTLPRPITLPHAELAELVANGHVASCSLEPDPYLSVHELMAGKSALKVLVRHWGNKYTVWCRRKTASPTERAPANLSVEDVLRVTINPDLYKMRMQAGLTPGAFERMVWGGVVSGIVPPRQVEYPYELPVTRITVQSLGQTCDLWTTIPTDHLVIGQPAHLGMHNVLAVQSVDKMATQFAPARAVFEDDELFTWWGVQAVLPCCDGENHP